jgi:serine O-acetyltransferase
MKLFNAIYPNISADLRSHGGNWAAQGFWALVVYRFGGWGYGVRPVILRQELSLIYRLADKMVQIVCGIELPCEVELGRNLVTDHSGGIVISGYAMFGENRRACNGVVVGLSSVDDPRALVIGNNVDINAGAKLLGRITIGENCLIGANAVVTRDVPTNSIAVGLASTVEPRRSSA